MVEIYWTNEAESWLKDIFDYIALDNQKTAKKVVREIYEQAQILKTQPKLGYPYLNSEEEIRILLYGHYRIAYLIESEKKISILGVFHGALEIDRYLK